LIIGINRKENEPMADSSTKKRIKGLLRQVQRTQSPEERRSLLRRALDLDPSNEHVNMWLAVYAQDEQERDYYVRRVQEINPRNRAIKWLDKLMDQMPDSPAPMPETNISTHTPLNLSMLFLIMTSLVLVGLGGFLFFRENRHQADLVLLEEGLRAPATITELWVDEGEDSDSYQVGFAFTAIQQGEEVRFENLNNTVTFDTYQSLFPGETVEVIYPADNPARARLELEFNEEFLQARFTRERTLILIVIAATVIFDIPMILFLRSRKPKADRLPSGDY
jgi:hypothetical protein